jgi:hypothetical protein
LSAVGLKSVLKVGGRVSEIGTTVIKNEEIAEELARTAEVAKSVKFETHHLLPREFKSSFEKVGLNIEAKEFKIELPIGEHRLKPRGIHTGTENWNKKWEDFFINNPEAEKEQILKQLEKMMKELNSPKGE